jgi:hypothetical protein
MNHHSIEEIKLQEEIGLDMEIQNCFGVWGY